MGLRGISLIALYLVMMGRIIFAQDIPLDGYFTASDGVKIHYVTQGKGTAVILIHGYSANAQNNWFLNGIAQALARNHRVVAMDCRNHGKSDKPEPMMQGRAEDVIEMMDHLKIQKAHFPAVANHGVHKLVFRGAAFNLDSDIGTCRFKCSLFIFNGIICENSIPPKYNFVPHLRRSSP